MRYFTHSDFLKKFSSQSQCLKTILVRKYPYGSICSKCKKVTKHYKLRKRPCYSCSKCGNHLYPLSGTIFEKSRTPLPTWFYAIFLMTSTRAGISAKQLQRQTGVSYKTAWRMSHQIRKLMQQANPTDISGTIEVDEAFIGGRIQNNKRKWYGNQDPKEVVIGMVERGGSVIVRHVVSRGARALLEQIQDYIPVNSHVMTDDYRGYSKLKKLGYKHGVISHSEFKYKIDETYTQNIENFWSHLKRGLTGVYRKVSPKHLQKYCEEFAFRYNHRKNPSQMFDVLISKASEKS